MNSADQQHDLKFLLAGIALLVSGLIYFKRMEDTLRQINTP